MPRKRINLKYPKERAILSDVLPYETPVIFTNRHFYSFLLKHRIELKIENNDRNIISWEKNDSARGLDETIRLIFGIEKKISISEEERLIASRKVEFNTCPLDKYGLIPFVYKISHKLTEFRELGIPHPRHQVEIVSFYEKYKELILYYCSLSSFSIRKPAKTAKFIFYRDEMHRLNRAVGHTIVEESGKEYENLKSFFVYKNYSNIYKFYESHQFHRCEKKYNRLLKLDISKCFDSIYTHSISWAIFGKEIVKKHVSESKKTFSGCFDKLMQNINYNETHGIIIGPELSRIFSEILLQAVDRFLENELASQKYGLINKVHYEIFRYVDDYFVFYNEDREKEMIVSALRRALKIYKLSLNSEKEIIYEKPIITEISIVKQKIASLLEEKITYHLREDTDENGEELKKGRIYINSKNLITSFKTILKEGNVSYQEMMNYSFATIEHKCDSILKKYSELTDVSRSEEELIHAIVSIFEFSFFIYSVSPRVNVTIRLCRIIQIFCSFLKKNLIEKGRKHLVYKCIYDNISFILKKNKTSEYMQVETLYLLIALGELGKDYWLEEATLAEYFNLKLGKDNKYISSSKLNYFSCTVLLFYMKTKVKYKKLRDFIVKEIKKKFSLGDSAFYQKTELTMLLLDTLSCPFIEEVTKREILENCGISDPIQQNNIIQFNKGKFWFVTWTNFNFEKELYAKQGQEVY